MNESTYWKDCCFITLTYDDEHLPEDKGLHKDDLQRYFKRLRKDISPRKIKYFACGEYGEKNGRPHYHAIVYGIAPYEKDILYRNWKKCVYERFDVGTVTAESTRYVAQYVLKKYNGKKALLEYGEKQSPFQLISQGIGKRFCDDNAEQLKDNGFLYFYGARCGLPRYYSNRLGFVPERKYGRDKRKLKYFKRVLELSDGQLKILFQRHTMTEILNMLDEYSGECAQRELDMKTMFSQFERKL